MKLFHIPLKLIEDHNLTNSDELAQLTKDVKDWEADAIPEHEEKVKSYYGTLHKGIYFRLLAPFVYLFAKSEFNKIIEPPKEENNFLD